MEDFLKIFKEHEDELEVACPDFAVRVQELMQADIVATNRVGSRYSKHFSEDITMRCGGPKTPAEKTGEKTGEAPGSSDAAAEKTGAGPGSSTAAAEKTGEKKTGAGSDATNPLLNKPPSLSLEQRIKLQLNEKMAEDREMSQMVASMEEKILENEDDVVEVDFDNRNIAEAQAMFVEMCSECGERHIHDERECHFCGEVHEGCCDL